MKEIYDEYGTPIIQTGLFFDPTIGQWSQMRSTEIKLPQYSRPFVPVPRSTASVYDYTWGLGMFPTVPTQSTGGGDDDSVNPPGQDRSTKTRIPGTSSEFLSMPDLNKAIDDEIKRLTMSIIEDSKDLILSKTVNYKSIDFFPEAEVQIIPPKKQIKFIRDQFNEIVGAVQKNINKSKKAYSTYNYVEYLDFFEVQYNNSDGKPIVKFKIDLQDFNLDELSVVNLRRIG